MCVNRYRTVALSAIVIPSHVIPSRAAENAALTTRFTYEASVPQTEPATKGITRLWVPLPSDSQWQTISDVQTEGAKSLITTEKKFGNRMVYFEGKAPLKVKVAFTVARRDVRVLAPGGEISVAKPKWLKSSLQPDAKVPIGGRWEELAKQIAGDKTDASSEMRAFFDNVVATMQYDYKKESPKLGDGDVAFVCDYKKGNCSDLHSYIISLGRSVGVPAIIEYGFPITGIPVDEPIKTEGKIGGYHCWTWFKDPDRGWIPLDASDARRWLDKERPDMRNFLFGNLVTPRAAVTMARGRDINLVPAQQSAPLNYFVYPYAEIGGTPVKAEWTMTYNLLEYNPAKP